MVDLLARTDSRAEPEIEAAPSAPAASSSAEGLSCLPLFFPLAGRTVVLAGDGEALVWKAELLYSTGAYLRVFAPQPVPRLAAFLQSEDHEAEKPAPSASSQEQRCLWHQRPIRAEDLSGAALVIAACDEDSEAAALLAMARAAGVPINIIDRPERSDFQFGAILDRSPLVIGISTHGAAPALAQALRGRLEAWLPASLQHWAAAARNWRARLKREPVNNPRRFWSLFSQAALAADREAPRETDFQRMREESQKQDDAESLEETISPNQKGVVALVGAGPGDPELLTLKALRFLQEADVVLYDDLVSPRIVAMARRDAEKIPVGKRGYRPSCRQDHITAQLVALGLAGKKVVRLKGGDPMIFGRANEEIAALRAVGVRVEVVPGITAALGAAASLQMSLTERDKARRLQFITAHAHDGSLPDDMDWRALCDPRASSIVYMGVKTLQALASRLLAEGIDPTTPALLIERATQRDERVLAGTIESLPPLVAAAAPDGPCLVFIGAAFASPETETSKDSVIEAAL
ncbi:siroheme synthase CysG [Beijerinckia indica]|uniref:Uroporphyrin-III C-methyltransferase n=1 Tax=Beijerinckia indica subsp. indica (strain ATCC 9039 / DSM 1715 / NCIMB 8712) TaxID=395963 RepID=B2ICN3_BEII9|nr:siroheme synthase CysG [Beijerinckia indica]ACB93922.1 uroporphyrin-III C-methyltransferase [Beijerinckia indica subsp. indica ATCC 9039]